MILGYKINVQITLCQYTEKGIHFTTHNLANYLIFSLLVKF